MAILPLGHKATQPQSPGEFVAGLGTSQVGVHRKLSPLHRLSGEAGCAGARAEAQQIRCQLAIGHWHSRQLVLWGCPVPGWHQGAARCTLMGFRGPIWRCNSILVAKYHQNCPFCGAQFPSKCQPRYGRHFFRTANWSKALKGYSLVI